MSQIRTLILLLPFLLHDSFAQDSTYLKLGKTIKGQISPKSIVHSGNGLFFAQNMMYKHKITIYDRNYELVKTLDDDIDLSYCGHKNYKGVFQGSPVEAAFSHKGKYAWVSNYQMYGDGFENPGTDGCRISDSYDSSFVYMINTENYDLEAAIKVGAIPKYIAVSPNNKLVLVSNWCSGDLSIISTTWLKEVKRIKLGKYPRGIVIDNKSKTAYVAIMGETRIAVIDLESYKVSWIENVGKKPRHLCMDSKSEFLYASINSENKIRKIDVLSKQIVATARTQKTPRSMVLSDDDKDIFVVNYHSNTMSHISAENMKTVQTVNTDHHPIGITYDPKTSDVWVACYSGSIMIFNQKKWTPPVLASTEVPETEAPEEITPVQEPEERQEETETIEVETEVIETQEAQGPYHIIVGAFSDPENVQRMLQKCIDKGFKPYIVNKGAAVQKVSCANYNSRAAAQANLSRAKNNIEPGAWILKK